jgi:hypothetical protein
MKSRMRKKNNKGYKTRNKTKKYRRMRYRGGVGTPPGSPTGSDPPSPLPVGAALAAADELSGEFDGLENDEVVGTPLGTAAASPLGDGSPLLDEPPSPDFIDLPSGYAPPSPDFIELQSGNTPPSPDFIELPSDDEMDGARLDEGDITIDAEEDKELVRIASDELDLPLAKRSRGRPRREDAEAAARIAARGQAATNRRKIATRSKTRDPKSGGSRKRKNKGRKEKNKSRKRKGRKSQKLRK